MPTSATHHFQPDPALASLAGTLPDAETLAKALVSATRRGRESVAGLWLSEGFPAIFGGCPAVYEEIRAWLASSLMVHSKDVTLVGSARTGYSMAPKKYGRPFRPESDLDLVIVSSKLFADVEATFTQFKTDVHNGTVIARHPKEADYWSENLAFGARNIPQGFLDANKLPNFNRYPIVQRINQAMFMLVKRLNATKDAPSVKSASARIYKDWPSFMARLTFNLHDLGSKLGASESQQQVQGPTSSPSAMTRP